MGLRKLPPTERDELRLIDIRDFDLTACGGTHVAQTGQIASILLRKVEKVRQGWRVEFVAGQRAVATARRDFTTLTETAALFSAHIYDVPQQARKSLDEIRSLRKQREQSLGRTRRRPGRRAACRNSEANGRKLVVRTLADRDLNFVKLLAQKSDAPLDQRRRASGDHVAAAVAGLRAVRGPALRHGRAHERDDDEAGRTRRWQQRPGARRHPQCRRNRCHAERDCRDARSLTVGNSEQELRREPELRKKRRTRREGGKLVLKPGSPRSEPPKRGTPSIDSRLRPAAACAIVPTRPSDRRDG